MNPLGSEPLTTISAKSEAAKNTGVYTGSVRCLITVYVYFLQAFPSRLADDPTRAVILRRFLSDWRGLVRRLDFRGRA